MLYVHITIIIRYICIYLSTYIKKHVKQATLIHYTILT